MAHFRVDGSSIESGALAYLIEENRLLRRQLGGRRLRLTEDDRQRLAVRAFGLGRRALRKIATIVTPDTLLRWHRQSRRAFDDRADPERAESAAHAGAVGLVADVPARALGRDRGCGFLPTEVWTWRWLVTYYTVFVIDLASRRVHIVGSTLHPHEGCMRVAADV